MNVLTIVELKDMKNQPHKLVKNVILVVDVVKELLHLTVLVVTLDLISMKEFVELVHQDIMEMMMTGHVNSVTEHVVNVQDQKPLIVPIVATKQAALIYKTMDNVYIHVEPVIMPMLILENVNNVTQNVQHVTDLKIAIVKLVI